MRFVEPVRGPGQMVRPPGVEPGQGRQEVQEMTETRNSSVKQKPHIPTISRMKKPPVSRGPARELGCCRGTCPPPAAGCMVTAFALDQKSTGVLPMLLMILFYHIFLALRCNFQISPKFFATSLIKSPCHCFAVRSDTPSFNAAPNTV